MIDLRLERDRDSCAIPMSRTAPHGHWEAWLLLLVLLTAVLYAGTLRELVRDWWNDPDYSHGFLVPLVAGYVAWRNRLRYKSIVLRPSNAGLAIVLFALSLFFAGTLGADLFTPRISLCILLAGLVVYLCGWAMLRALAFPLCYLALMVPLPGIVYNQITLPMQLLASRIAENLINLVGIPVFREGNLLRVPHYAVEVALACSGIRSLLTLIALGVAYAYFAERRTWSRLTLVVLMLPIAIFTNALRITISCLVGYRFGAEWAEGFLHFFSGWLIFLIALSLLFLVHFFLNWGSRSVLKEPANA